MKEYDIYNKLSSESLIVNYARSAWHARLEGDIKSWNTNGLKLYDLVATTPRLLIADYNSYDAYCIGDCYNSLLRFLSNDSDIQEVKAENSLFFLYKCINNRCLNTGTIDDMSSIAAMKLFLLFSSDDASFLSNRLNGPYEESTKRKINNIIKYLSQFFSNDKIKLLEVERERESAFWFYQRLLASYSYDSEGIQTEHSIQETTIEKEAGRKALLSLYMEIADEIYMYVSYKLRNSY